MSANANTIESLGAQLIARIWTRMADGVTFPECRAAEMATICAGPEVWEQVDQHFAERAAHPADEGSEA